jgi:hypothetical protein
MVKTYEITSLVQNPIGNYSFVWLQAEYLMNIDHIHTYIKS